MNVWTSALTTAVVIASIGASVHAQAPATNAELRAQVKALQAELAGLQSDMKLLVANCVANPAPVPVPATTNSAVVAPRPACVVWSNAENRCLDARVATPEMPWLGLTAPEIAGIDRTRFDKVFAAGKAVATAQHMSALGVTPRQFRQLLLTFTTELSIASDRATTKGERALAAKYQLAALQFDLGLLEGSQRSKNYGLDSMTIATASLEAANQVYLRK